MVSGVAREAEGRQSTRPALERPAEPPDEAHRAWRSEPCLLYQGCHVENNNCIYAALWFVCPVLPHSKAVETIHIAFIFYYIFLIEHRLDYNNEEHTR